MLLAGHIGLKAFRLSLLHGDTPLGLAIGILHPAPIKVVLIDGIQYLYGITGMGGFQLLKTMLRLGAGFLFRRHPVMGLWSGPQLINRRAGDFLTVPNVVGQVEACLQLLKAHPLAKVRQLGHTLAVRENKTLPLAAQTVSLLCQAAR